MSWIADKVRSLDGRVRGSSMFVILALATVFVSSVITIGGAVIRARDYFQATVGWRALESEKLNRLVAGTNIGMFAALLGPPLFVRESSETVSGYYGSRGWVTEPVTESTFRGHGYWVQAIHDRTGLVLVMSVTSCDVTFQPTFDRAAPHPITLHRTTFADLGSAEYKKLRYFISGATANTYIYEEYYGGNPSNYQTIAWGINDACPYTIDYSLLGALRDAERGVLSEGLQTFRQSTAVNTYVETAAQFNETEGIWKAFQFGADRILLRTVPD